MTLYRVRLDQQRPDLGYKSRNYDKRFPAAINKALKAVKLPKVRGIPMTVRIQGSTKGSLLLTDEWVRFLQKINTPKAFKYLQRVGNGWANGSNWPKVEMLTFGGNVVSVNRIDGNKAYIDTFVVTDAPPTYYFPTRPPSQIFTVTYSDNSYELASPVGTVYTLLISAPGEKLWIDTSMLIRA